MNDKSKRIIKSLLLSAAASFLHQGATASEMQEESYPDVSLPESGQKFIKGLVRRTFKSVLTVRKNGEISVIDQHRSQSSHRSHSSHRSGSSGSHYSHSSHRSSSYSGGSSSSSSSRSSLYSAPTPKKTVATYELGDRKLKKGLYGNDVGELITFLENTL